MFEVHTAKEKKGSKQIIMFLSLMLLLLAFFILLQSLSTLEEQKLEAVVESIEDSFNFDRALIITEGPIVSKLDENFAYPDQVRELGDLFETEFKLVKVTRIKSGDKLTIDVAAEELYEGDTSKIFPYNTGVLDRVIDALSKTYRKGKYKLDFLVFRPRRNYTEEKRRKILMRAGDMAQYLIKMGVSSEQIGVGIEMGDPKFVRFIFHRESRLLKQSDEEKTEEAE